MTLSERHRLLAARRELLIQRIGDQRFALARAAQPLAGSWERVERVLTLWREVRSRPWLIAAPAALLLWWRPRTAVRLVAAVPMLLRLGHWMPLLRRH